MTAHWSEILVSAGQGSGLTTDALILDVIRPAWTPDAAAFVLREPERAGPSARYRVFADPGGTAAVCARLTAAADATGRDVNVRPMPAGSARFDLAEIFGGPAAVPAICGLLAELAGPVFALLARLRSAELSRAGVGFDLMVAAMALIDADIFGIDQEREHPVAFICFRSSADGFLLMCRDPGRAAERFEECYQLGRAGFIERLPAVLGQLNQPGSPAAALTGAVAPRLPGIRALIESGDIIARSKPSGYIGDQFDLGPSAFHQIIQGAPQFQEFMRTDPRFHTMRVCLSVLCAVLHQLGIRVIDRYVLSHCLARAAEDVYGIPATDVLSSLRVMRATT